MRRTLSLIASLIICPHLISCSGTSNGSCGTPPPTTSSVTVAPATVSLNKGGSQTFTATVNGTMDQSVFWEIVEATPKSGDSTHGFISNGGVYVAPTTVPSPANVTIKAVSGADTTKSGTAAVTIQAGPATNVSITGGSSSVSTFGSTQFIATVTGNLNTAVTWQVNGVNNGGPQTGAISATGLFKAPNSVPVLASGNNSGQTSQVVVTAISQADRTAMDSVLVTIVPPQQNAQGASSPLGVSGGNAKDSSTVSGQTLCCGGTLGALVSRGGGLYILSNNHAIARSDSATAGDPIVQPGLIDNNCAVPPTVATLSQFFNMETGPAPKIDAALALINTGAVDPANPQSKPVIVGDSSPTGHTVAACSLPGPQSATAARLAVQRAAVSAEPMQSALTVRDARLAELMSHPEVQAVGVGASYDNSNEPAILLFVTKGQPRSNLPAQIDGIRTRIVEGTLFSRRGAVTATESTALEEGAVPPQIVYPISDAEVARAKIVHAAHSDEWMKKAGVQGVGIGSSADAPGEAALVIFLIRGVAHDAIPPVIDGLRTRVRESSRFRAGFGDAPANSGCSMPAARKTPPRVSNSRPKP